MKKFFAYTTIASLLLAPAVLLAADFRSGEQPSISSKERITNDVYIAGGTVTSAGAVVGDLFAAGGTIVVSGPVGADLVVAGGNVTILAPVADDVRAAGGTIVIQGKITGDLLVGGGQVTVGGPGIGGDLAGAGGTIRLDAPVAGDVHIAGGNVYINAPISGTITIDADTVTLGSEAVIAGDLTYKSSKELIKEEGAAVKGKINYEPRAPKAAIPWAAFATAWSVGKFLALLACALVLGLMLRRYALALVAKATERPLLELGRGLLSIAAFPVLSGLLMVTLVGIPLGLLGLLSFFVLLLVAWIATPIIAGSVVYRYFSKSELEVSWKTITLGAVVYSVVGIVPILGWFAQCLIMLLALGAVVATAWESAKEWR